MIFWEQRKPGEGKIHQTQHPTKHQMFLGVVEDRGPPTSPCPNLHFKFYFHTLLEKKDLTELNLVEIHEVVGKEVQYVCPEDWCFISNFVSL